MFKANLLSALVGAAIVGAIWAVVATITHVQRDIHSPTGDIDVNYMVQTSPTTANGAGLSGVTAIEFHPAYIVVTTKNGAGSVFIAEKTVTFSWSKREASK